MKHNRTRRLNRQAICHCKSIRVSVVSSRLGSLLTKYAGVSWFVLGTYSLDMCDSSSSAHFVCTMLLMSLLLLTATTRIA